MAGNLSHSPADIIRELLVDLGVASDPTPGTQWSVTVGNLPNDPDRNICVVDTSPEVQGRHMHDGEIQEIHGFQLIIRSTTHRIGWAKVSTIGTTLVAKASVYDKIVTVGGSTYLVHHVTKSSGPIPLGYESETKRHYFTWNGLVSVRQQ